MSTNMSTNVTPYESLTGFLALKACKNLEIKQDDSKVKKYFKYTANTVAFTALAIGGTIESFVRGLLVILVKAGQFFVPKQYTKKLDNKVLFPLFRSLNDTLIYTAKSAAFIITRFTSKETCIRTARTLERNIDKLFESKFMEKVLNVHINGFYKEEPKKVEESKKIASKTVPTKTSEIKTQATTTQEVVQPGFVASYLNKAYNYLPSGFKALIG